VDRIRPKKGPGNLSATRSAKSGNTETLDPAKQDTDPFSSAAAPLMIRLQRLRVARILALRSFASSGEPR
jgi:hypothetical protein